MKHIIKEGKRNYHEAVCGECGCVFSFEREDCYWDRPLLTYITHCPSCDNEIWVGDIFDD